MKVVILAGGKGTRLAEETTMRPKPMVEIGGKPILWHIMQLYAARGFTDFLVACGYKGELIKEYFHNFAIHSSDYFVNLANGQRTQVNGCGLDWQVGLIDTGADTMTGGRLLRLRKLLGDEPFMVTYGDGLGDINACALAEFHRSHGKLATVTAVRPPARFGSLVLHGSTVCEFAEKAQADEGWINGGFFVFNPEIFDYLEDDATILERDPLERLAKEKQLMAFRHAGFWQPMDTLRERLLLESLWASGQAPWKIWT
jgi:glucose-1-phosphate cytidylyltransferase